MDNAIPTAAHRLIVGRPADHEALDLQGDSFRELGDWMDAELAKLEARFATRGTGRCPKGFYLSSRR